jgi:hypothetical protein
MKQDLRRATHQVAQFIYIDLTKNEKLLDQVERYSSFDYMKKNYNSSLVDILAQRGHALKHLIKFICKRFVDGWRSVMTDEQSERFNAVLVEKTRHIDGLDAFGAPSSNSNK